MRNKANQPIPKEVIGLGTTWRQSNNAKLFQFEKESAARHIFVLAIGGFPIPGTTEFPGGAFPIFCKKPLTLSHHSAIMLS